MFNNISRRYGVRYYASQSIQGATKRSRGSRALKVAAYTGGVIGTGLAIDKYYMDNAVTRSIRTIYCSAMIAWDNKMSDLPDHKRNAYYLQEMISKNKGLYIKLGQIMSMQSSMFPPEYQEVLRQFLDNAPSDDWSLIQKTLALELGPNYEDSIELEKEPIASASIAQVHKGIWKPTGEKVAVKVQHDSISKQMNLDLWSYRLIMKLYEYSFDMQLDFISKYIATKLKEECDFNIEYQNGEDLNALISNSSMKNDVKIPKHFFHSKKVIITEFIEGDSFRNLQDHKKKKIMDTLITCFSRQAFEWGVVHCDPHPGNFMILPNNKLVILDHGLVLRLPQKVKEEYCNFWKALFELNFAEVGKIAVGWGIATPEFLSGMASSNPKIIFQKLQQKHREEKGPDAKMDAKDLNKYFHDQMKNFFSNTDKFPLELVFLTRAMRMIQLLNFSFGSPSNRIGIMSAIAIRNARIYSTAISENSARLKAGGHSIMFNWKNLYNLIILKTVVFISDAAYHFFRLRQVVRNFFGIKDKGMEQTMEAQFADIAKELDIDLDQDQSHLLK